MMKTIRRIIAVLTLVVVLGLIGYFVYTGKRVNDYPSEVEAFQNYIFDGNDGSMVVFKEEGAWYCSREGDVILMEIVSYEEGVLTIGREEKLRRFIVINEGLMYDADEKIILLRR